MKLRNVTLATAILLALTGCGSSGGGGGSSTPNSEVNNQQNTQAQVEQQKAEMEALKKQLTEAQNNQKQQQDKLQSDLEAQKNALAKAQENLTASQSKLTKAEADLKTALENEQKGNANKTTLQNQLNQANENLRLAQTEKANAEKALVDRIAEENKLLTREEVFNLALNSGFNRTDANNLADDLQNNKKSVVTKEFIETHKTIALKRIARAYGLSNDEIEIFAKENRNKTLAEAESVLESKQQERQNFIEELTKLAQEKGLDAKEANNFTYQNGNSSRKDALSNLDKLASEKAIQIQKQPKLTATEQKEAQNEFASMLADLSLGYIPSTSPSNVKDMSWTINGKTYNGKDIPNYGKVISDLNIDDFISGWSTTEIQETVDGKQQPKGELRMYKMPYSVVAGVYYGEIPPSYGTPQVNNFAANEDASYSYSGIYTQSLPSNITANYKGKAFTGKEIADLNYQIQFGAGNQGSGKGSISGFSAGDIVLQEAPIGKVGTSIRYIQDEQLITENKEIFGLLGDAVFQNGNTARYHVVIQGKNASEITGKVSYSSGIQAIGFGGERQ